VDLGVGVGREGEERKRRGKEKMRKAKDTPLLQI